MSLAFVPLLVLRLSTNAGADDPTSAPDADAFISDAGIKNLDPAAAWTEAELRRGDFHDCIAAGKSIHVCYRESVTRALPLYRQAFDTSHATHLEALRSCLALARTVEQRAGESPSPSICVTQPGWFPLACRAISGECDISAMDAYGGPSYPWWPALWRGSALLRRHKIREAALEFDAALASYLTSAGSDASFTEAWNIFRELERATILTCGADCRLESIPSRLIGRISALFERFSTGCHRNAVPGMIEACEELNKLRFESALIYVRDHQDYQAAATLLADAYRDCVVTSSGRVEDLTAGVLGCWRSYGRHSLVLRAREAGDRGPMDRRQIEIARGLATSFVVRDMGRTCEAGTRQAEVWEACNFLRMLDHAQVEPNAPTTVASRGGGLVNGAAIATIFPVSMESGVDSGSEGISPDLPRLFASPLFDQLLGGQPLTTELVTSQVRALEHELAARAEPNIMSNAEDGIESLEQWGEYSYVRLLRFSAESMRRATVDAGSAASSLPLPSPSVAGNEDEDEDGDGRLRTTVFRGGITVLGLVGGGGLAVAGVSALVGLSAEQSLRSDLKEHPRWTAAEVRRSRSFEHGEMANRALVGGLVTAGAGILVGTAMLIIDSARQRRRRGTRARWQAAGMRILF